LLPRIYSPQPLLLAQTQLLDVAASHHLKVLRVNTNDKLVLFDGQDQQYLAIITKIGKQIEVYIESKQAKSVESPLRLHLAQSLLRTDKMDWVIQKTVELGVSSIQLLYTQHTVIKLTPPRLAKKMDHWQKVIQSACEQCERNQVPQLLPPLSLNHYLSRELDGPLLWMDPHARHSLAQLTPPLPMIRLLLGPESGFSELEHSLLTKYATPCRLGPRILRAETAPLAAISALQTLYGDLG